MRRKEVELRSRGETAEVGRQAEYLGGVKCKQIVPGSRETQRWTEANKTRLEIPSARTPTHQHLTRRAAATIWKV